MKIEFDLPKFEKEISINIVIRKDGEVVEEFNSLGSTTSPSPDSSDLGDFVASLQQAVDSKGQAVESRTKPVEKEDSPKKPTSFGGNFMDPSLF